MVKWLGFLVFSQAARVRLSVWKNVCIFYFTFLLKKRITKNIQDISIYIYFKEAEDLGILAFYYWYELNPAFTSLMKRDELLFSSKTAVGLFSLVTWAQP